MTLTSAKCRHHRIDLRSAAGRFSDHRGIATPHDFGIADTPRHYPLSRMRDRAVSKLRSSVLIAPIKAKFQNHAGSSVGFTGSFALAVPTDANSAAAATKPITLPGIVLSP
jgi:hypothetical protein